jgi:hypothetical protein
MTSASSLLKNSFAIARAAGYVDRILKGLVKKAKNPPHPQGASEESQKSKARG